MWMCFWWQKRKPEIELNKPVDYVPSVEQPRINVEPVAPKFAFVVGHNEKNQGAVNYLGESEWTFNKRIAKKAISELEELGVKSAMILRPRGPYSHQCESVAEQARELGVEYAFSLHFNAAGTPKASGCEVLVKLETETEEDELVANYLSDLLKKEFGIRQRYGDGVKYISEGHNGNGMLSSLNKSGITACLVEPCFATNRKEAEKIFEAEDKYVDVLVEAAFKLATGVLNGKEN